MLSPANYPELLNVPAQCRNIRPWNPEAIQVRGAYQDVNDASVELQPIIDINWPTSKYALFSKDSKYETDTDGALGYQSADELSVLAELRKLANSARSNTASVKAPGVKDAIKNLAQQAGVLFGQIGDAYTVFSSGTVYPMPDGNVAYFPLSVTEKQMAQVIDTDKAGVYQIPRQDARKAIREKWHRALLLLWCAMYGHAQSEAYNQNKVIYDARPAAHQGSFAVRPKGSTPPMNWGVVTMPPLPPPPTGGPEGIRGIPVPVPKPLEPVPDARMPMASKVMLGSAAALALAAGIRAIFFAPSTAPRF